MTISKLKRIFLQLLRVVVDLCCDLYTRYFWPDERFKVPPVENDVLLLPAVEIAHQIRTGKLKAETVMRCYVDRMKQVNPYINAIIDERYDEAIKEAQMIDQEIENGANFDDKPLLGVPISSKDSMGMKNLRCTGGLSMFRSRVQDEDVQVIKNLRKAGAIPVCITNVPYGCMWHTSENKVFGRTNNPYDLNRVPGGSSGGEAALIGSGASIVGVGTDIGGSIRIPAFSCGVWGHKTTSNIISDLGKFPTLPEAKQRYFTVGPMTRYAADLIPALKAMAGDDIAKLPLIDGQADLKGLWKVYYLLDDMDPMKPRVNGQVKRAILKLTRYLEDSGAEVEAVSFPEFSKTIPMFFACMAETGGKKMAQVLAGSFEPNATEEINVLNEFITEILTRKTEFTSHVIFFCFLEKAIAKLGPDFAKELLRLREELIAKFQLMLGQNAIFILPSAPTVPPKHSTTIPWLTNISYFMMMNIIGLPVTQCPIGLDRKTGCPLGIQIAAGPYQDHLTLNVAQHVEKLFGGWRPPYRA